MVRWSVCVSVGVVGGSIGQLVRWQVMSHVGQSIGRFVRLRRSGAGAAGAVSVAVRIAPAPGATPRASLRFCLPQVGHTSGFTAAARCPRWGHHSEARGVPHPPPSPGYRTHYMNSDDLHDLLPACTLNDWRTCPEVSLASCRFAKSTYRLQGACSKLAPAQESGLTSWTSAGTAPAMRDVE